MSENEDTSKIAVAPTGLEGLDVDPWPLTEENTLSLPARAEPGVLGSPAPPAPWRRRREMARRGRSVSQPRGPAAFVGVRSKPEPKGEPAAAAVGESGGEEPSQSEPAEPVEPMRGSGVAAKERALARSSH